ncbi:FBD-associated F-box protein [Hordeum vulgare]|nr:FBD-associated F-box protein At4g10400-like [Hordeum vulgare subsp. vulgare]KAE8766479.1 FBD-associated F-box protein [Hordeum vulgare]
MTRPPAAAAAAAIPKPKRKRRRRPKAGKGAAADSPDCFSNLPDDIVLAIANRLPTRLAVTLSVLSRRFRHLPSLYAHLDSLRFSSAASPVPLHATQPKLLRRLDIVPPKRIKPSAIRHVIAAAADHGLSELSVRLHRRVCLPKSAFFIRSLTVLSLDTCGVPPLSTVACARLRTLKLHRVYIKQEALNAILSAATGLQTLEMVFCTGLDAGCTVESLSVRSFSFKPGTEQREVTLRATELRAITLHTRPKTRKVHLEPSPDVRKAYLHVAKSMEMLFFRMRPFLDAATVLASLTLRGFAMKLLADEYKDIAKLPVTFQGLRILSVSLDFSRESEAVLLVKLLESCPGLQQLTVSAAENKKIDTGFSFADHKKMLTKASCLTKSLAQIKFLGFNSEEYLKDLLVFLLNRTDKLRKIGVQFQESEETVVKWALSVRPAPIEKRSNLFSKPYLQLEYP